MSPLEEAAREVIDVFTASGTLTDIGPALTCSEADALRGMFIAAGEDQWAAELLDAHAAEDDEGDAHYVAPALTSV